VLADNNQEYAEDESVYSGHAESCLLVSECSEEEWTALLCYVLLCYAHALLCLALLCYALLCYTLLCLIQ
jgi:hypothetical protein